MSKQNQQIPAARLISTLRRQLTKHQEEVYQGYKIAGGLIDSLADVEDFDARDPDMQYACALRTIFDLLWSGVDDLIRDLDEAELTIEASQPATAGTITKHLERRAN